MLKTRYKFIKRLYSDYIIMFKDNKYNSYKKRYIIYKVLEDI